MDISLAAIEVAYYIVHGHPLPRDAAFSKIAENLPYLILVSCNTEPVIQAYPNYEAAVSQVSKEALRPYRLRDTDYLGVTRYLKNMRSQQEFVKLRGQYGGHVLTGGHAPKEEGSLGSVFTLFGDSYPANVLGLEWK